MRLSAALLAAYALGSIPTAYLLVKRLTGMDVRSIGSGNVGATNASRAAGKGVGILVLVLDVLKGVLASTLVPAWLLPSALPGARLGCGLAAVLGHCFPCTLRFQGGKGVATTIGALVGADPHVAGLVLATWVAIFGVWRYVSLGSLAAAVAVPVSQVALHRSATEVLLGIVLTVLVWTRHRANVARLLEGTEPRFGERRPSSTDAEAEKTVDRVRKETL